MNAYLDSIEKVGFTGVVLIESNGRIVVSRAFGMRNVQRNIKNDPYSVMDIGSLTKQFTAAAILKLEMQGKLSTEDTIGKFFYNVPADKSQITLHDLLRHSSGMVGDIGGDYEKITREEFLAKLMATPLESKVGEEFAYSNIGYSLLAMIVEKASGKRYEDFLYENLFRPAGMNSTGYSRPKFDPDVIAVGYRWDGMLWGKPTDKAWDGDAPFWHLRGNGGILSTAVDLAKWSVALRGDRILSRSAKQKLYHPRLRPDEHDNPYYGYGWDIFRTRRNTLLATHNGTNNIFYAEVHRFLDEKLSIIHLTNRGIPSFADINKQISRIIFESEYVPTIPAAENEANQRYTEEIIALALEKGLDAAIRENASRKPGVDLIERFINRKGYQLMRDKNLTQAIEVFKLNTVAFPRSSNVYDSLGEAYVEAGETKLAIDSFQKSLDVDPENENASQMIGKLLKK
ncbi:MAG: serine hydrolase [Pyrinomonadaceae bacterium]|nr:serine hydrolase [Pyrinomonadaceae bacterium]